MNAFYQTLLEDSTPEIRTRGYEVHQINNKFAVFQHHDHHDTYEYLGMCNILDDAIGFIIDHATTEE